MPPESAFDAATERRLREVGDLLRRLDDPALRREVILDLRGAAADVMAQQRAALQALPKSPSEWKATGSNALRVKVDLGGPRPAVAIVLPRARATRGPWLLNDGKWRHPLFGNRKKWFEQKTRRGWFDETARRNHARFQRAAEKSLDDATERIARRIDAL